MNLWDEANEAIVFDDDYETAIEIYKKLAAHGEHEAYVNLVDCYRCQGEYEEAAAWADKVEALKMKPSEDGYDYFALAEVYYETGQFEKAHYWVKFAVEAEHEEAQELREVIEEELAGM